MVDPAPLIPGAVGLPPAPGVYRFRDQAGRVLYVGRAVSLRRWITGEQKVTRAPGGQDDADVYGWADGVLVCFEIRDGRMSGWP